MHRDTIIVYKNATIDASSPVTSSDILVGKSKIKSFGFFADKALTVDIKAKLPGISSPQDYVLIASVNVGAGGSNTYSTEFVSEHMQIVMRAGSATTEFSAVYFGGSGE